MTTQPEIEGALVSWDAPSFYEEAEVWPAAPLTDETIAAFEVELHRLIEALKAAVRRGYPVETGVHLWQRKDLYGPASSRSVDRG